MKISLFCCLTFCCYLFECLLFRYVKKYTQFKISNLALNDYEENKCYILKRKTMIQHGLCKNPDYVLLLRSNQFNPTLYALQISMMRIRCYIILNTTNCFLYLKFIYRIVASTNTSRLVTCLGQQHPLLLHKTRIVTPPKT